MKSDWRVIALGEVCDVVNGGTPKTDVSAFWGGPHMWITPAEMGRRLSPYVAQTERRLTDEGLNAANLLPPFSVILSSRAPIGHLVINTVPMATNQGCKGLVPKPSLDSKYLYYFLLSIVDVLNELGTGTTFKELSGANLKKVLLTLPPLKEQRRIIATLDKTFEAIATVAANAERNFANARAIFVEQLASEFSELSRKSEEVSLKDIASEISDGDHQPPPKASNGVPFITISDIDKDTHEINFGDTFRVPITYYAALKQNRKPMKGDVLYTVTGSFGIPVLVNTNAQFCFQRHIALVRPAHAVDSQWLYYLLLSPGVFAQSSARATGTAQKTVSLAALRGIRVPRTSLGEQLQIAARLRSARAQVDNLARLYQRKLDLLAELKQSLLRAALIGSLTGPRPIPLGVAAE